MENLKCKEANKYIELTKDLGSLHIISTNTLYIYTVICIYLKGNDHVMGSLEG